MDLPDVNILIYAYNPDADQHERYRDWLDQLVNGQEPFGLSELAVSGFMRIVTNPVFLRRGESAEPARQFAAALMASPGRVSLLPGPRHWGIFFELCTLLDLRGNRIPDACHAALALEHDVDFVTADRGFASFPDLRWRHPF